MKLPWIQNTDGKPDAMLTFSVLSLGFVLAKFLVAGTTLAILGHSIDFGQTDGASIAAILTPTLGAYVTRRYTDRKYVVVPNPNTASLQSVSNQAGS